MNYLICDKCNFKNSIYTERVVFCNHCNQKMKNNFIDWKKANNSSSFESYINEVTTTDGTPLILKNSIENSSKKFSFKNPYHYFKSNTTKDTRLFIFASLAQLFIFFVIIFSQGYEFEIANNVIQKDKVQLDQIKWSNYKLPGNLAITLPFELKKSNTVLPNYMTSYLTINNSRRAETCKSFSVTIEELQMDSNNIMDNAIRKDLRILKDQYMDSPSTYFTSNEDFEYFKIKNYQTELQHGSYISHEKKYLYNNYTLTNGNKIIKIIISYLQDDELLCNYADIVSQSIYNNILNI